MNISIITQYSFIVVAIGTMLLAMATGIVGTISILKGQSLIGDAVGHASLPGIILAFMISGRKSAVILMLGAIVAGIVAFMLIQIISEGSKIEADKLHIRTGGIYTERGCLYNTCGINYISCPVYTVLQRDKGICL